MNASPRKPPQKKNNNIRFFLQIDWLITPLRLSATNPVYSIYPCRHGYNHDRYFLLVCFFKVGFYRRVVYSVAPLAETGSSHRLTAYKIEGHFFGLSYWKISGNNQVKNSFFRISNISVPCPHAQLRGRTVIEKLWTFFGPWGRDRSQSPPWWIFWVQQIHQSTVSERTTRLVYSGDVLWKVGDGGWTVSACSDHRWYHSHKL